MKVLNIFFIILFVCSAALQYNDTDPWLWMPLYLYGALICFLALKKTYRSIFYFIGLVIYSAYAIYLLTETNGVIAWVNKYEAESLVQSMKATKPWIEETREFFGLVILILALIVNMAWLHRAKKPLNRQPLVES